MVDLSGPYFKIRTAKRTNQNSSFQRGQLWSFSAHTHTANPYTTRRLSKFNLPFRDELPARFNGEAEIAINC